MVKEAKVVKLGDRVRSLLEVKQLTQVQLAENAGLNASLLSRLLAGERDWRPEHILAIATALSTTPLELVSGTDSVSILSEWVPQSEFNKAEHERLVAVQELDLLRAQNRRQSERIAELEPVARRAETLKMQLDTANMLLDVAMRERNDLALQLDSVLPEWERCKVSNASLGRLLANANRQLTAVREEAARVKVGAGLATGLGVLAGVLAADKFRK